ncbi:GGDEF domain-containing protein [Aquincola sp. S2]|uniref:GGDEF domain-containing protein n=1 Tax=Pseudaquabacterium terrae TaxID=2732868 RepID=A0ABX2EQS2_9BURK|nr:GGDEF domain-containing protein [Aquabacterium terrae]
MTPNSGFANASETGCGCTPAGAWWSATSTAARYGWPEQFTIILEGLRSATNAKTLAGKLVETLGAPTALAGKLCEITASVGVALWNAGDTDDAELLRRADVALYEAKRRGRNGYFCEEADALSTSFSALGGPSDFVRH